VMFRDSKHDVSSLEAMQVRRGRIKFDDAAPAGGRSRRLRTPVPAARCAIGSAGRNPILPENCR
jgi:hypothetical protein